MSNPIEFTVESLAYRGAGVARHNGCVHFVPGTAPGERVVAEVTRCHKNFNEARVLEILEPSPDRIPRCCVLPSGDPLPGAVYDHLRYDAEVRAKTRQLADALTWRGPSAPRDFEIASISSPLDSHYRNKTTLHAGVDNNTRCLGYWTEDRTRVIDLVACPLSRHEINAALAAFRLRPEFQQLRRNDVVNLRWTARDGALCWVNNGPNIIGDPVKRHLAEADGTQVERDGFYQVNPEVAALLAHRVAQWFDEGRTTAPRVLDLYCGVGVFATACGLRGAEDVRGVEVSAGAVACARANARRQNVKARFEAQDIEARAEILLAAGCCAKTTVIVDPPRRGLAPAVCHALAASGAPRVIYISCDPATLGRDMKILKAAGYEPRRAAMFDMFPRTAHFESAVEVEKQ
jgi:23S rRNA (uracil1939-C5)-methyltransferase